MDNLEQDTLVADHIERRLSRSRAAFEEILASVLDRREERAEAGVTHIAELRKRAAEVDAKLKRLYDAIENGVADLADPMLKDRVAELKVTRDQAHADAERAEGALKRVGPSITPQALKTFARQARKRMRTAAGGYRRDYLRALRPTRRSRRARTSRQSWGRKANCCVPSSPLQAQKRRVLACPVLYRSGAPEGIRTPDLCLRRATLYPAELRARAP